MRSLGMVVVLAMIAMVVTLGQAAPEKAAKPVAAKPTPAVPLLGKLDFPVTVRSTVAKQHFTRGVLALHSFFYDEALDEFVAARKAEPGSRWRCGAKR